MNKCIFDAKKHEVRSSLHGEQQVRESISDVHSPFIKPRSHNSVDASSGLYGALAGKEINKFS